MYGFLFGVAVGAFALTSIVQYTIKNRFVCKRNDNVECLKNALLTLALQIAAKDDIEHDNYRYDTFNGDTLPAMAGCDLFNACTSYIIDRSEFRKDPWYTDNMDQKSVVIEKYLTKKFATLYDVDAFFNKFILDLKKET